MTTLYGHPGTQAFTLCRLAGVAREYVNLRSVRSYHDVISSVFLPEHVHLPVSDPEKLRYIHRNPGQFLIQPFGFR